MPARKWGQIGWFWASLGSLGSEWSKMTQNFLILSVSWQPGIRMIENDAKFVDLERLLAAWAQNDQNDAKFVDFERLLATWGQNARKWCKLIIFGSLAQNDRKLRWIGWFENTRNGLIFSISAASADRIMGVSRRRADELKSIYINISPPPLEPGKMKNRALRSGDPGETKPFC